MGYARDFEMMQKKRPCQSVDDLIETQERWSIGGNFHLGRNLE